MVRVLGVDPGTFRMGVGVVDSDGSSLSLVYCDVLAPNRRDPMYRRLYSLYVRLSEAILQWGPSEVAIEEPFAGQNIRAAMAIGHAQAVAMIAAAKHDLPVSNYAPRAVKRAVTDYGGSSKEQVQEMVKVILGMDELPQTSDAADALAVAICHINSRGIEQLVIRE